MKIPLQIAVVLELFAKINKGLVYIEGGGPHSHVGVGIEGGGSTLSSTHAGLAFTKRGDSLVIYNYYDKICLQSLAHETIASFQIQIIDAVIIM